MKKKIVVGSLLSWSGGAINEKHIAIHLVISRQEGTNHTTLVVRRTSMDIDVVKDYELEVYADRWEMLWT